MSTVIEAIKKRSSTRGYTSQPLTEEELSTLIEAGLIEEAADPDAPVTKGEVQQIVTDALAPMLKAFSLPQNLNNEGQVAKGQEHYLHGLL